ncbi:MAG: hypothetical protein ACXU9G_01515 [Syntrophales bacterium]
MKIKQLPKAGLFVVVISVLSFIALSAVAIRPLYADMLDSIEQRYLLYSLPGKGQFVDSPRRADLKNSTFPLEVIKDGYKMVRVYQDLMDHELVEWAWLVTLRNRTAREVTFSLEYKLQDDDSFLLASSLEQGRKIAPGETVTLEKKDSMPYGSAKRITASKIDIQLQ